MGKQLRLANGTVLDVSDASIVSCVVMVFASTADMMSTWGLFTEANLATVEFLVNGTTAGTYTDRVPAGMAADTDSDNYVARFYTKKKPLSEVENLMAHVDVLNGEKAALAEEIADYEAVIGPRINSAEEEITGAQEALVEVYEMIAGGI